MTEPHPTELKQRYLNARREFRLDSDRIRAYTKDADGEVEFSIPYEEITSGTRHVTEQSGRLYIATISFAVFSLVGLAASAVGVPALMRWVPFWIIATPILFAFHLAKRRRYVLLDLADGKSVFFLRDRPSKQKLHEFLEAIQLAKKKYLRDAYLAPSPHDDTQREMTKYRWLLREGAITEAEFDEFAKQLGAPPNAEVSDESTEVKKRRLH